MKTEEACIDLSTTTVSDTSSLQWLADPYLMLVDKDRLMRKDWLNCRLIEAAQCLLKEAAPTMEGLQTPLNGEGYKFRQVSGRFIQVLNVHNKSHWIVVSNVGCEAGVVNIFDSAYNFLDLNMKKQICSLWQPSFNEVELRLVNIQHQPNGSDCAIACATELAHDRDPQLCVWETERMRPHLRDCFENRKIEPFPLWRPRRITIHNRFKSCIKEDIYCICRMPNDPHVAMICCDKCSKWYHKKCMGIELNVNLHGVKWYCNTCK